MIEAHGEQRKALLSLDTIFVVFVPLATSEFSVRYARMVPNARDWYCRNRLQEVDRYPRKEDSSRITGNSSIIW